MQIDAFLPKYDFTEIHKVTVKASPQKTLAAVKDLLPSELSPLVFWMLAARSLPARLMGQRTPGTGDDERPFLAQLYTGGFIPLEESDQEVVFGLVGQFWKLVGEEHVEIDGPQAFLDFERTDFAKVAANLAVQPAGEGTLLSTETRIAAPDEQTRRKFAFYWRLISFGSGWIRVMWLRAIKRKAEARK
ncbi:MAG: hypothetical protein AB1894_24010 [Chloroflexota bacterium]